MQANLQINTSKPSFGIAVSKNFRKAAHNYFYGVAYLDYNKGIGHFDKKVKTAERYYGYDDYEIVHKKIHEKGKTFHALYAQKGESRIHLTTEDVFRKVLNYFVRLNKENLTEIMEASKTSQV